MSTVSNSERQGGAWNPDWKIVAASAGFVYLAILLLGAELLGLARAAWLDPRYGRDMAVAIELTIILPFAWYASALVASKMQLSPGWRAAALMALITFLLTTGAYLALAAPSQEEASPLTNGSLGLDIGIQALVAALPFASRRVLRKPPAAPQAGGVANECGPYGSARPT